MQKRISISCIIISAAFIVGFAYEQPAKNLDVLPKDEWRVCTKDNECKARVVDCVNAGAYVALNRKFEEDDDLYFKLKCQERIKKGEVETYVERGDQPPQAQCIKQKCEVVQEKRLPSEDKPLYFERIKKWFSDLF